MQPQQFQFGDQPWPDGKGVLQVYAPIGLSINPELAELIGQCRTAARGAPVTEVDDRFLHTTLGCYRWLHCGSGLADRARRAGLRAA